MVVDAGLHDNTAEELVKEMRAMHRSLPILLTAIQGTAALETRFADDRCIAVLEKPYTAQRLEECLTHLGLCRREGGG